jgi:excisionase family DNA binding protein
VAKGERVNDRLLTVPEAAAIARVSVRTAWREIKREKLPSVLVGAQRRVRESDALRWAGLNGDDGDEASRA